MVWIAVAGKKCYEKFGYLTPLHICMILYSVHIMMVWVACSCRASDILPLIDLGLKHRNSVRRHPDVLPSQLPHKKLLLRLVCSHMTEKWVYHADCMRRAVFPAPKILPSWSRINIVWWERHSQTCLSFLDDALLNVGCIQGMQSGMNTKENVMQSRSYFAADPSVSNASSVCWLLIRHSSKSSINVYINSKKGECEIKNQANM